MRYGPNFNPVQIVTWINFTKHFPHWFEMQLLSYLLFQMFLDVFLDSLFYSTDLSSCLFASILQLIPVWLPYLCFSEIPLVQGCSFTLTDVSHTVEVLVTWGTRSAKEGGSGMGSQHSQIHCTFYGLWSELVSFYFFFFYLGLCRWSHIGHWAGKHFGGCVPLSYPCSFLIFILNNLMKTPILLSKEWDVAGYSFSFPLRMTHFSQNNIWSRMIKRDSSNFF